MKLAEQILEKLNTKVQLAADLSKIEIEDALQKLADADINAKAEKNVIYVEKEDQKKALQVLKSVVESDGKPVNYTIKAVLTFPDQTENRGNMRIKAKDAKEAEAMAREKLKKNWPGVSKIEFVSIKRG